MKRINTYIIFGILALIGIFALISWNSKRNSNTLKIAENKTELWNVENPQEKRDLKLKVSYNYGETTKTISEKATAEIVKSTMKSTNWNEFHIVQLEDENGNGCEEATNPLIPNDNKLNIKQPTTTNP